VLARPQSYLYTIRYGTYGAGLRSQAYLLFTAAYVPCRVVALGPFRMLAHRSALPYCAASAHAHTTVKNASRSVLCTQHHGPRSTVLPCTAGWR
jgi:hypothetical protein